MRLTSREADSDHVRGGQPLNLHRARPINKLLDRRFCGRGFVAPGCFSLLLSGLMRRLKGPMVARTRHLRWIAAMVAAWTIVGGNAFAQAQQAPSKSDVVAALKDRERRLRCFSVAIEIALRQSTRPSRAGDGAEERASVGELSFLCDGPRIQAEWKMMQGAGDERAVVERAMAVADGNSTRQLMGSGDDWTFATIQPSRYRLSMLGDPRDYLTQVGPHEVLSTMLRSSTFGSVKVRTQGDARLVEIAPLPKRYIDNRREKWSVTFDMTRGFAMTHFVRYRAIDLKAPWIKAMETAAGEFIEAAPGVWVPTVARREDNHTFRTMDGAGKEIEQTSVQHVEVACKDWKINPRPEADAFVLDFPSGIEVQDELARYNEEMQKRQRTTAAPPLLPLFAMRSPTVGIWVNVGAAIALAALVVFRRRAKASSTTSDRP